MYLGMHPPVFLLFVVLVPVVHVEALNVLHDHLRVPALRPVVHQHLTAASAGSVIFQRFGTGTGTVGTVTCCLVEPEP
jgi:hypothetical protein